MNFYPAEPSKHPVVTLIVNVQRAAVENKSTVAARQKAPGNIRMYVPNLGEKAVKYALAVICDCRIGDISIQFHDQSDRSKLN